MSGTFTELLHRGHVQTFSVRRTLVDERSEHQRILLFENEAFGRVLALDGIVQLAERDEASYSEMMVHPPVFEHGAVYNAMIVGGGDGAVAEEILKHEKIETVDLVEIDRRVVEISREHLGSVHGKAFEDPRLSVRIGDAFAFLKKRWQRYDLVVADRPDPVGPAERLFEHEFYRRVARSLRPNGIAVFQTGAPFFQAEELAEAIARMRGAFSWIKPYLTVTPTYTGGYLAIVRGSHGPLFADRLEDAVYIAKRSKIQTDHYTAELHHAAYAAPAWIASLVARAGRSHEVGA